MIFPNPVDYGARFGKREDDEEMFRLDRKFPHDDGDSVKMKGFGFRERRFQLQDEKIPP